MKIATVFIILLLVLLPLMAVSMTGDGTIKGRLQTFISYGLSLTSLLLCLLTIIVSVYSITSDIDHRQIYTVITKPIRRFQLLLGKLLGVILLDVLLLVLFSAIIYATAIYMPKFLQASDSELTLLNNEFFTARAGLIPEKIDVSKEVLDTYKKLQEAGQLPQDVLENKLSRESYIEALTKQIELSKRAAPVGNELVWEFNNVKPLDPNQSLFVKFQYDVSVNPPDLQVYGRWVVGDIRQLPFDIYTFDRKDLIRTFYEFEVPADAVADDGYLAVAFLNVPLNNTVVIFPPEDGLEVLYKADSFTANFIRAALLILLRLLFLAALATLAATFLSFPTALLFCLVVFFTGTISGFCLESFDFVGENLSKFYTYTIRPIVQLLPQFDKFSPTKFLVPARLLSWSLLAKVVVSLICIKAIILLLLAILIFKFREIAKIVI